jgi:methylated-DNA-protein-cysteine methyltransferase-like protein
MASSKSSDFFEQVWQVVELIPEGRVTSYGTIAKYLGAPRSSRMVGYAMNACFSAGRPIPAHRVLNRNGMLTGKHHFPNPFQMQEQLEAEGVEVKEDVVVKWKELFWDPNLELSIE